MNRKFKKTKRVVGALTVGGIMAFGVAGPASAHHGNGFNGKWYQSCTDAGARYTYNTAVWAQFGKILGLC